MKFKLGEICILKAHGIEVEILAVGPYHTVPVYIPYVCGGTGQHCTYPCGAPCDYLIQRGDLAVAMCNEEHLKKLDDGNQPADEVFTEKFTRKYGKVEA